MQRENNNYAIVNSHTAATSIKQFPRIENATDKLSGVSRVPDINAIAQAYCDTHLAQAHPFTWSKEICQFPRTRKVYPANENDDILMGHKRVGCIRMPLENLFKSNSRGPYAPFRLNLTKKIGDPKKHWVFVRYPETASLDFLSFDVDCHHVKGESKADRNSVEDTFWQQVRDIETLGIPGYWTTTPGQVVDRVHYQGLNYNVTFSEPMLVSELRKLAQQFRTALGWKSISTQVDNHEGLTRNYRTLGQWKVDICNVDSDNRIIIPRAETFSENLEIWHSRPKVEIELVREILDWFAPAAEPSTPTPIAATNPLSNPRSELSVAIEENAFRRLVGNRGGKDSILSSLVRKVGGAKGHFESVVNQAKMEFTKHSVPHGYLDHVDNPKRLDALVRRTTKWFFEKYDTEKAIPKWRLEKDERDKLVFTPSAACINDTSFVLRHAPARLSYEQKQKLVQFLGLMKQYNGRVAAKRIYESPDRICTKDEWFDLRRILTGYIYIAAGHDKHKKICTQYALTRAFIETLNHAMNANEAYKALCERKKEEIVYVVLCEWDDTTDDSEAEFIPPIPDCALFWLNGMTKQQSGRFCDTSIAP